MKSQGEISGTLFDALESCGWVWEGERLYAPNRTFWTQGTRGQKTPPGMLINMRGSVKAALESNRASKPAHWSVEQHRDWVSDMESLMGTLESLLEK
jgi:hypothetical protein